MISKFYLFFMCLLLSINCIGQGGTLDTTFGDNGKVTINLEQVLGVDILNNISQNTVQLNDGSYVSYTQYDVNMGGGLPEQNVLIKLLSTGDLDDSFGNNGIVTFDSFGEAGYYKDLWAKSGGKLLITDYGNIGNGEKFYLRQLKVDGSVDTAYGTNGVTQIFQEEETRICTAMDGNERIIAVRGTSVSEGTGLQFKRFLANGQIDTSFGNNGLVNVSFANEELIVRDFKLLNNGSMIVASSVIDFNGEDLLLITKHHPWGSLDSSFSENGIATSPILFDFYSNIYLSVFGNEAVLVSIVVLPGHNSNGYNIIYKLNADGSLDENFAANGSLIPSNVSKPLVQENERFLVLTHDYGDTELQPRGPFSIRSFFNDGFQDPSVSFQTEPNDNYIIFIDYFIDDTDKILITAPSDNPESISFYRLSNNLLGVSEINSRSFTINPNPTQDLITISCAECFLKNKPYQITDATGKIILQANFSMENPTISLEELATGLYYLTIDNTTTKLVKQ